MAAVQGCEVGLGGGPAGALGGGLAGALGVTRFEQAMRLRGVIAMTRQELV